MRWLKAANGIVAVGAVAMTRDPGTQTRDGGPRQRGFADSCGVYDHGPGAGAPTGFECFQCRFKRRGQPLNWHGASLWLRFSCVPRT